MSKTEERDDKGPDKEESIPTASMGGSAVGPGGQIGPYKLLSILGEGGFGVVYLAERQRPVKRRVALKVIKPGMDTKQVIARFEAERQALALLEHPNIAHVFNAGTTDAGRPYFVMEYVKGIPITEHCDRHKLTIEERLRLFLRVCEAVQHAHQKGIIHRDIKPTNIQVCIEGEKAVPKVIDFGVVKAISQPLTERTLVTEQGQFVGTPEYMSPEQAEMTGQDVDTRSDIYSLGVVLYELLTGVLPFDPATLREGGVDHIRQVILEEDPKTPSTRLSTLGGEESTRLAQRRRIDPGTLRRRLRGDLDWITLKAMEKDRTRRYQTAHALDEDIQRHLTHEPVLAGPPSKIYRLKKFLRKYRTQAIAAAMMAILVAAVAVIFVMYVQAVNRGKEAESLKHRDTLSKAMELRSSGQFQEALTKVEAIVDSEHVGPKAHLLRGRLVLELQGPAAAVKELQKLLNERDEIACQAHFLLARIYLESDAGDPETTEEYKQKAKEHQQKGEKLFSESAEAYFNRSMMAGTVNKTLEWLNKAIDFDPGHYDSREARALAYYALRKYGEMEIDASVMIGNESNNSQGYALRAIARREKAIRQSEKELFGAAIRDHDKAITLSLGEAELYDQRRQTYMKMGNYEQVLSDARKCAELEPEEGIYHFHVFCALAASGRYDEAKVKYDTIIKSGLISKWNLGLSAAKYVSDTLDAGLSWYPPQRRPEGAAFLTMHESAEIYEQLAKKAKRVVAEGFHANWSPDGTELVYSCGIHGFSGIEIINLESGKTRLLTVPGFDPAWSPDGHHIAYVRVRQPLLLAEVTTEYGAEIAPQAQREVWIIKADGTGEPRFLARGGFPCWSRNSRRVFYHSPRDMKVCSISIEDGAKPTPLISCPSSFPVVSPDEKYVAYMWGGELRIVELASKSVVASWTAPLVSVGGSLNWSPNGRELSITGRFGLWIYNLDTKTAANALSGQIGWSSWSRPDMSQFAFQRTYGLLHREIWVANLDPNVSTTEALGPGRTVEEHYQEMVDYYTRRIDTEPEDAGNYLSRAECYVYLQNEEKAVADLEKYVSINPSRAGQVYANMAWSLVSMQGSKGDPAIAAHLAQRAIEKAPENWSYHSILGGAQYYAGEYENAITTLEQADKMYVAKVQRSHPLNAAFITMSLHQLGRRQEAEGALAKLRVMFEGGRNKSLQKYLIEAEQLFAGKDSKIWVVWDCIKAEKLNKALELLEAQSALSEEGDPNFPERIQSVRRHLSWQYFQRGSTNASEEDYDEAIADYESAVKADPGYALACNNLAWLQATCPEGEFRNGVQAVEKATRACELTNWKNASYIDTLAAAYAEIGDFESAVKWQKKSVDLLPKEQRSRYHKAKVKLYQAGQPYHRQRLFAKQMVGWWTFEQVKGKSVPDSSGKNLDGKLVGDAKIISDGQRGNVLSLNGDGDHVIVPDGGDWLNGLDALTVCLWVKSNVTATDKGFIIFEDPNNTDNRDMRYDAAGTAGGTAGGTGGAGTNLIKCGVTSDAAEGPPEWPGRQQLESSSNIQTTDWQHLAMTWISGNRVALYINGKLDRPTWVEPAKVGTLIGYTKLIIGKGGKDIGIDKSWNGLIDDVRIYSYALSEAEIKALYAGDGSGPTSN